MAQSNQNIKKIKKRKNRKEEGSRMRDFKTGDVLIAPNFYDIPYEEPDKEMKRLEKKLGRQKI